jgi:hypothetical protein
MIKIHCHLLEPKLTRPGLARVNNHPQAHYEGYNIGGREEGISFQFLSHGGELNCLLPASNLQVGC